MLFFLLSACIFIAVGAADFDSPSTNLFADASFDSTLFDGGNFDSLSTNPDSETMFAPSTESSANLFRDDPNQVDGNELWNVDSLFDVNNDDPYEPIDPISSSLLAGDIACDMSQNDDEIRLLDKVRRGQSCKAPPVGQAQTPGTPGGTPNNDEVPMSPYQSLFERYFQRDYQACPGKIFGQSNVPVCKDETEAEDFIPLGPNLFHIGFVSPCTYIPTCRLC